MKTTGWFYGFARHPLATALMLVSYAGGFSQIHYIGMYSFVCAAYIVGELGRTNQRNKENGKGYFSGINGLKVLSLPLVCMLLSGATVFFLVGIV